MDRRADTEKLDKFFLSVQDLFWQEFEARYSGIKDGPITIAIFSIMGKHRSRAIAMLNDKFFTSIHLSSDGCG